MSGRATWTSEDIRRLRNLWDEGLSASQIGQRLGYSKSGVIGKAHRLGLDARQSPIGARPSTIWTDEAISELKSMRADGIAVSEIARRLGCDKSTVYQQLRDVGIIQRPVEQCLSGTLPPLASETITTAILPDAVLREREVPPIPDTDPHADTRAKVLEMVDTGFGRRRVAEVLGVSVHFVREITEGAGRKFERPKAAVVLHMAAVPTYRGKAAPCCWPIGEPRTKAFRLCDDPSMLGKPYCLAHAKLAYVRVRDHREEAA